MGDPIVTKINVQDIPYKIKGTLYDERGYNTDGGMTQSALTNLFDDIDLTLSKNESMLNGFTLTSAEGFYIIDENGNVCFVINNQGVFDVLEIGANIRSKIGEITNTSINTALESVNQSIATLEGNINALGDVSEIQNKLINQVLTNEEGFRIIDSDGNICFVVDSDGNVDALDFGNNLKSKIQYAIKNNNENFNILKSHIIQITNKDGIAISTIKAYATEEDGIYFTDENGWIGCQYVNGEWSFNNLTNSGSGTNITSNDEHSVIERINKTIESDRKNKDTVTIQPSLFVTESNQQTTISTTITNTTARKKFIARLRLHHGSTKYTPDAYDMFFNSQCKTDFSDVRFFDSNGKLLRARFNEACNFGIYKDLNVKGYLYVTSQGYLVTYKSGVAVSKDNGNTWVKIANTTNVTEHPSSQNLYKSIYVVFVGRHQNNRDVMFGYAGGKLYKIITDFTTLNTNNELVATITEVLDFSWDYNGTTIYPDIQPHAIDEDINGNLYVGFYQITDYYHIQIFVSTQGGGEGTWVERYYYYNQTEKRQQHVHHIHADKYTSNVYVGIDGGFPAQGPTVLVTNDAGVTWTDITTRLKLQRGHDYYPSYFGSDYKLGGGECYTLGGNAIIKGAATNDIKTTYKGYGGVRSFADFGDDSIIIAGVSRNTRYSENQILISYDKGDNWTTISRLDVPPETSGDGYRQAVFCGTLATDTNPCIILPGGAYAGPTRIYKGIDYYREVEIELNDVPASDITITAKTGYANIYPFSKVRGFEDESLVYEVPFNEGCGNLIQDSKNNIVKVNGSIEWESEEEPVRYGEYSSELNNRPFKFSSGAKITGTINFGKIPSLNFSSGYTITYWFNEKNRKSYYDDENKYGSLSDNTKHLLVALGNIEIVRYNASITVCERGSGYTNRTSKSYNGQTLSCSDNYYFIAIVIKSNVENLPTDEFPIEVFVNGNTLVGGGSYSNWTAWSESNLSESDLVIGSGDTETCGYMSDFKIYHKELSVDECLNLYKGYNYK